MVATDIARTGARPGDKVRCLTSGEPHRYTPGQVFTVVDFCGTPHVWPNSVRGSDWHLGDWNGPMRGYGATWEMVP